MASISVRKGGVASISVSLLCLSVLVKGVWPLYLSSSEGVASVSDSFNEGGVAFVLVSVSEGGVASMSVSMKECVAFVLVSVSVRGVAFISQFQ